MSVSTPNCKFQHCDWYVSQNITKRLVKKRYLKKGRKDIMDHVWWYIQSQTEADLVDNRVAMMERLKIFEQSHNKTEHCYLPFYLHPPWRF